MKILLVEDSRILRQENESALLRAGYDVVVAEDGLSALQLAKEQNPDLILLDMILPKMSGPDVLKNLKSNPTTAKIPVIILSSLSGLNREKLMDMGAEEFLEKGAMLPTRGVNLLPQTLEKILCRILRKQ